MISLFDSFNRPQEQKNMVSKRVNLNFIILSNIKKTYLNMIKFKTNFNLIFLFSTILLIFYSCSNTDEKISLTKVEGSPAYDNSSIEIKDISNEGENLLVSVLLEPQININHQFDICKLASLSIVDLLNSISSIIGSEFKSNDGIDLSDLLLSNRGKGREYLVVEASTRTALRKGEWVIIPPYDAPALNKNVNIELGNSNNFQLYNLEDDPSQKNNLAKIEKEKLKEIYNEFLKIRGDNFADIEILILE